MPGQLVFLDSGQAKVVSVCLREQCVVCVLWGACQCQRDVGRGHWHPMAVLVATEWVREATFETPEGTGMFPFAKQDGNLGSESGDS